jgi:hypothetical protein
MPNKLGEGIFLYYFRKERRIAHFVERLLAQYSKSIKRLSKNEMVK